MLHSSRLLLAFAFVVLASCGGGGDEQLAAAPPDPAPSNDPVGARLLTRTPIEGLGAVSDFRFGYGTVAGDRYYLPNQTSASLDVFDTATSRPVVTITGSDELAFSGVVAGTPGSATSPFVDSTWVSGPNSVTAVGSLLYVTDVDSVKVVDGSQGRVVQSIRLAASGRRADTACADADHNLLMVATPESSPPRLTLIDTATRTVQATVTLPDVLVPGRVTILSGEPVLIARRGSVSAAMTRTRRASTWAG
jgi:hypothetical protein